MRVKQKTIRLRIQDDETEHLNNRFKIKTISSFNLQKCVWGLFRNYRESCFYPQFIAEQPRKHTEITPLA